MSRYTPRDRTAVTAPRDWTAMSRTDFDTSAEPGALFDLDHPSQVRPDPRETSGDLLALITED